VETIETNVLGTANLLEAIRLEGRRCAVVIVTSDKCYENREWVHGYREEDSLGGHDVYSASKAATELVTASYRRSFFPPALLSQHGVALASARSGNVIGGGDWAQDRIVPDAITALAAGRPIPVRNPEAVRPWQHVLEPLGGYLLLGARLLEGGNAAGAACEAWNFGPSLEASVPVSSLVTALLRHWGEGGWEDRRDPAAPHEAGLLRLSIDKAWHRLGWAPRWSLDDAVSRTVAWYRAFLSGAGAEALRSLSLVQIDDFLSGAGA
jgi:CDP-glucose 4,6-dehydratase